MLTLETYSNTLVQILCSYRAHLMIYIKMCAFWAKFFPLSSSSRNIQSLIITVLCLFLFCIKQGSAIKCWECNSKHDPRCADPFQNFSIALVDCDQKAADVTHLMDDEKYTVDTGEPKASICRKTYQFVQEELRIIRGCGWVENFGFVKDRTCFNRAGTHQVQMLHCVCSTDGCNTAATPFKLSQFLTLLIPILPGYLMLQ